jgi:hypothetical protein
MGSRKVVVLRAMCPGGRRRRRRWRRRRWKPRLAGVEKRVDVAGGQ